MALTSVFVACIFIFANLFDYSMDLAGAGTLLSIFLSIVSFILIFLFKKRAEAIDKAIKNKNYIARWHFSKDEWEKFLNVEYSYRAAEKKGLFFFLGAITLIIFTAFIIFIPEGRLFMFVVMVTLILLYAFMAFLLPLIRYAVHRKSDAEVLILEKGVLLDGQFHTWDDPGSEFSSAIMGDKPYPHFQVVYSFTDRIGKRAYTVIVPIPEFADGKEILNRLLAANQKR